MSDSDDTDVLLLIPPDLFIVPSSDSEEDFDLGARKKYRRTGVVSEILEHVQSLETRISAIESREESLEVLPLDASVDSHSQAIAHPSADFTPTRQSQPPGALSRISSLQNTPVKPLYCSSLKSSPSCVPLSAVVNSAKLNEARLICPSKSADVTNRINACSPIRQKQEGLIHFGDSTTQARHSFKSSGILSKLERPQCQSSLAASARRNTNAECPASSCELTSGPEYNSRVEDMELSEVDALLRAMEATEIDSAKRIDAYNAGRCREERERPKNPGDYSTTVGRNVQETSIVAKSPMRRLEFQFADEEIRRPFASLNLPRDKEATEHADVSLPEEDSSWFEKNPVRISDFKMWEESMQASARMSNRNGRYFEKVDKLAADSESTNINVEKPEVTGINTYIGTNDSCKTELRTARSSDISNGDTQISSAKSTNGRSLPDMKNSDVGLYALSDNRKSRTIGCNNGGTDDTVDSGLQGTRQSQCTDELQQTIREIRMTGNSRMNSPAGKNSDTYSRKSQRLLALSDFWDCDGTKSQEEMLRIRLEEEKFRREHCEHLIQELQKRLLEQQEKVAVAIRVDNEKNTAISQFQNAWSKLRQRWDNLEKEHMELRTNLKNITEKHQSEVTEYQQQIKKDDGELSKALDLAAGYKEKSDSLMKEKLELLKSHADELEKYKSLVQEAELRYENMREDYNKFLERNRQLEEIGNNAQQELNKERLRSAEVRTEMGVIHKALDACEAELTILRQEKESLQLKVKEEITRNGILEQNKASLLDAMNEAKNAEKAAKEETKLLITRQEQIRSELREIYQKQLDDVVKTKLREFQEQLDAAELAFQADLETRQRAIAECAARKIKSIIDKHQLEINLLEEKHIEEKRLAEIQLAQASQRAVMLEVQLNSQRAGKTQLAEQLHSVMQKQWQQALQIISGGQMENLSPLQRLNAERSFDVKSSRRCHSACCNKDHKPAKPEMRSSSSQNLQNTSSRQGQDESLITLTSNDEAPITRKESEDDLRKYIKMILDMQQPNKDEFARAKYTEQNNCSTPPVTREVPRKHYTKRESNGLSEESVTWQHADEPSIHDTSEYIPISQPQGSKSDQQRSKPPWK